MLIRTHASEAAPLPPATVIGGSEFFVATEGSGGVELFENGATTTQPGDMPAKLLFTGGRYGIAGGEWLFMVGLWTPEDFREEFVAWYKIEHMPILLECPQWDGCRFVETPAEKGCQFVSLHQLSDRSALDSNERKRSRATPWFKRLSAHSWFDGAFTRSLYRRAGVGTGL
jgi:hypothetical protein